MTLDKRELYDGLNHFESEMESALRQFSEMKTALQEVLEKNATLEMENQRLRDYLQELKNETQDPVEAAKQEMSKSRLNLEKIYSDGFHICRESYGARRENDEECVFCLDVLYHESHH